MMLMLKVLVYPLWSDPQVQEIENSLEAMQQVVGGFIEIVNLGGISGINELDAYELICNEEGKLENLPPNRFFPYDYIAGQFFITKTDNKGEPVSLTDEDIELITNFIK